MVSTRGSQKSQETADLGASTSTAVASKRALRANAPNQGEPKAAAGTADHAAAAEHGAPAAADASNGLAVTEHAAANGGANSLDSFKRELDLALSVQSLQQQTADPTVFLQPNDQLSQVARQTAKALFRHAARALLSSGARSEAKALRSRADGAGLPLGAELHVEGFDAEQIWLQLEQATAAALRRVKKLVSTSTGGKGSSRAGAVPVLLKPEHEQAIHELLKDGPSGGSDDDEDDDEGSEGDAGEGESEGDEDSKEAAALDDGSGDEEAEQHTRKKARTGAHGRQGAGAEAVKGRHGTDPIEDRFMKLSDMEQFLEDAERKAQGGDEDDELLGGNEKGRGKKQRRDDEGEDDEGTGDEEDDEDAELALDGDLDASDVELDGLLQHSARLLGAGNKSKAPGKAAGGTGATYKDFFGDDGEDMDEDEPDEGASDDMSEGEGFEGDEGHAAGPSDEEDDFDDDDDDDDKAAGHAQRWHSLQPYEDHAAGATVAAKAGCGAEPDTRALSTHEQRLLRLQEQIAELEEQALGDKDWFLTGEADASRRPLNSALEIDMDFDTTAKPTPQPTEEAMADLETLIKRRIADHQFDDVVRVVPPPAEKQKRVIELDDMQSKKGLGELYEDEYVKAKVGGVTDDKDEKVRAEARALFQTVVAKLDALTNFHFAPKPMIEDIAVKTDVAAILMEEAAPVAVSKASMQLPGEVYKQQAEGQPLADGELSREDRKRKRAQRKRGAKKAREQREAEKRSRAAAEGGEAPVAGRKSADALDGASVKPGRQLKHGKTDFGKSTAVFGRLQEQQEQAKAGIKVAPKKDNPSVSAASLKL